MLCYMTILLVITTITMITIMTHDTIVIIAKNSWPRPPSSWLGEDWATRKSTHDPAWTPFSWPNEAIK